MSYVLQLDVYKFEIRLHVSGPFISDEYSFIKITVCLKFVRCVLLYTLSGAANFFFDAGMWSRPNSVSEVKS